MAVQYRIEYDDDNDVATRIDISDTTFSGAITALKAAADPLVIHMPQGADTHEPMQGSGGTIYVLASDSDGLRSLYTADPHKFMVTIYKGGTATANIVMLGWINTGVYTEAYSEFDNYPLSISFNDGLNSLKRFKYLNSGSPYTGEDVVLDVMLRVIAQTALAYHQISVATNLYYSGYTIASNNTILSNLDVINANYYDELDVAKNHYEVLEMILRALGLIMFTQGAVLYIIDPLELDETSFTMKNFNTSSGAYVDSDTITPVADIDTDCEWWRSGTQLDYKDGFSRIRLTYSGYAADNVLGLTNWSDTDYHSSAGSWSTISPGASYGDDYEQNLTWGGIDGWTLSNGAFWEATRYDGKEEYHVRWDRADPQGPQGNSGAVQTKLQYTGTSHILRGAVDSKLKISWGLHVMTADDGYYNPQKDMDVYYNSWFLVVLKVGNQYFNSTTGLWQSTTVNSLLRSNGDGGGMNDKWYEFATMVDFPSTVSGAVDLTIYDYHQLGSVKWYLFDSPDQRSIRIKDVAISVVDPQGYVQDFDINVDCDLDNLWNTDAPTIELEHGDSSFGVASHRAGFINNSGEWATNFRVAGMSVFKNLFEVLLKRYSSQYRESRLMLHGSVTASSIYGSGFGKLNVLTDSVNLAGKKFFLLSGNYHDREGYIEGDWIELFTDNITFA